MIERVKATAAAVMMIVAVVCVAGQGGPLRVVSAWPRGEIAELADADQVRIAFSEPMIAVGTPPPDAPPSWLHITPQVPGSFYWSGTKTLVFSPDPAAPLPQATTFTVRVDAAAASVAGHTLAAAYVFTFTTPPPQLIAAEWYRKSGVDGPVVISLRFDRPVDPGGMVARTRVTLDPHEWKGPTLSPRARAELARVDPAGLRRFDDKVAAVRRASARSDRVEIGLARAWDEERFPRDPRRLVVETKTAPPRDAFLRIVTHDTQFKVVPLEPTFFVMHVCQIGCDPGHNPIRMTQRVETRAFARALTIADVTDPSTERAVRPSRAPRDQTAFPLRSELQPADAGFDSQPRTHTWRLRLSPNLRAADGQILGYPWLEFVEARHAESFIALGGAVLEAAPDAKLPFHTRNVQALRQALASVSPGAVVASLRELDRRDPPTPSDAPTRVLDVTPDAVQTQALDLTGLLSPRGTGLVWADLAIAQDLTRYTTRDGVASLNEVVSPFASRRQRSLVQVTNLGVTVKNSPYSTVVFVTRLDTGEPVPGARVAIVSAAADTRWRGTTDGDGTAVAPALALRGAMGRWTLSFVVTADKDGDVAFVPSNWPSEYAGVNVYDHIPASALRGAVFTDRGVYKPEEDVHVKAVLREDTLEGMRLLPEGRALDAIVRDDRRREVDRRRVTLSRWSSTGWTWRAPAGSALGEYRIDLYEANADVDRAAPAVTGSFRVAAFRRPDFRVDATLTGDPPILGSTLSAGVRASYLFGAALVSRPIRAFWLREAVQRPPEAVRDRFPDERYAIGYLPDIASDRNELSSEDKPARLGADGRFDAAIATRTGADAAFVYHVEADVEGESRQHVANRASLVVHPSSIYVVVSRPPLFLDPKKGTRIGITAVDLSGRTVAGVPVTISLIRHRWSYRRSARDRNAFEWVLREMPSGEWTVRSAAVETTVPITVRDAGAYVVRAVARDSAGRPTRTDVAVYAIGSGLASWRSDGTRLDLVPERKKWKPGESARILIQSPWPRATALLTVEREGVRAHRRFDVASTHDVVEVPITEADVPNVYVSVLLVKGRTPAGSSSDEGDPGAPSYRLGYAELDVEDASKRLHVKVSADREAYRPGDPVNVSVALTAPDGSATAGEVTLWAVDRGLLSLTGYKTPDLLEAIYARKVLQVATIDNRHTLIRRGAIEMIGGLPSGLFGGVAGSALAEVLNASQAMMVGSSLAPHAIEGVRQDFRPLAFWLGSVTAGSDGRAAVRVTLPDSLTTYRIMAVAGNDASQFGFGEREVRVAKPLTLLPSFPRFMNLGDRAALGVVVTNASADDGAAVVTIESLDPGTLRFTETRRSIALAAGVSHSLTFDAVAAGKGSARVRIAASLGGETDAVQVPLTVAQPTQRETTAGYGEATAFSSERLALPNGILPDAGGLTVDLASTALVGLGESARYLDEYPYACTEQKASRAIALLLASDVGGAFTLEGNSPAAYRSSAISLLDELSSHQCRDGGYALWPPGEECTTGSIYLTAYVLHVMRIARSMQIAVDETRVNEALDFLEQGVTEPARDSRWWPVWSTSQAYAIKVLADYGRGPDASLDRLAAAADRLSIAALSHVADALAESGDTGPRYQAIVQRLMNAIRVDADRAHVEERDDEALGWLWNTNVTSTAVVLEGFTRRRDDAPLAASLARWLVGARANGRWGTTHENAMALLALTAYSRAFEAGAPRLTAQVSVGAATVGSATFDMRSTDARRIRVPMPDLLRHAGASRSPALSISRTGTGRLFYTARMETYAPIAPSAVDRGFRVERHYELYVKDGAAAPATSFAAGDLIRVTVTLTLRGEGRYLALTDPLPAGVEPLEDWALTTASDVAAKTRQLEGGGDWRSWWYGGYFDHVEKHDDRIVAFATRLAAGRHEFSYLVRATTAGTFAVQGTSVEAMYAPELTGRSAAATVTVR